MLFFAPIHVADLCLSSEARALLTTLLATLFACAHQDSDEEKPHYEYPGAEYDRGDGTVWPRPG